MTPGAYKDKIPNHLKKSQAYSADFRNTGMNHFQIREGKVNGLGNRRRQKFWKLTHI